MGQVEFDAGLRFSTPPSWWRFTGKASPATTCLRAAECSVSPITNAHALAETFATLTGFYKVPVEAATELTLSLDSFMQVEGISLADYKTAISEARQRGIMGGGIYDSLHATFARAKGAQEIVTRNPSHFAHAAPELRVVVP